MHKTPTSWFLILITITIGILHIQLAQCTSDHNDTTFHFQSSQESRNLNSKEQKQQEQPEEADLLHAEGSSFFPNQFKSSIKFPDETEVQESRSLVQAAQSQSQASVATSASDNLDDIDENTAIDIILAATKSGRSFDVGEGTEDLVKVTSDPKIREQVAAGNDAQARGYIKQKLCDLGLISCSEKEGGISNKHDYGFPPDYPPPYAAESGYLGNGGGEFDGPFGHGHGGGDFGGGGGFGGGTGIPFKDVTLVQPVAIKPVGLPISAVPLEPFKGGSSHSPIPFIPPGSYGHPHNKPYYGGGGGGGLPPPVGVHSGLGKQFYSPPPPTPSKPFVPPYSPKPYITGPFHGPPGPLGGGGIGNLGPLGGGGGNHKPFIPPGPAPGLGGLGGNLPIGGGKVVEHIHHHIHHTPSTGIKGHGTYGIIGGIGGSENYASQFDDYGAAAQKPSVSLSTLSGSNLGTFREKKSETFRGDFSDNRIDECSFTCVPINQCASYDIVSNSNQNGASGREIISGTGTGIGNSGLVGYNIDPRTKYGSEFGTHSNSSNSNRNSDVYRGSSSDIVEANYAENEDSVDNNSTEINDNENNNRRKKREVSTTTQPQPEAVAAESPNSNTGTGQGQARFLGALMRDATFQNLTRLAGYEFGNDPSQNLLKIEGTKLRLLGRLIGFEPTFGVSFGLSGGYPQHGGGYPLNPVGNNPIVNPYGGDGISLGLVSVNPLVSLQVGKDKDKTKLIKPLVNFHVTPNAALFGGIKGLIHKKKVKKLAALGLLNPLGWGAGAPVRPVHPVPVVPIHYPHYPEYPPTLYYPHRRPPPPPLRVGVFRPAHHHPHHHHHHHPPPPPHLHHHEHKHVHPIVPVPVPIPTVTKYYESPVYTVGKGGWKEGPYTGYGSGYGYGYGDFRANKGSSSDQANDKFYKGESDESSSSTYVEEEPEYSSSYGSNNGAGGGFSSSSGGSSSSYDNDNDNNGGGYSTGYKEGPLPGGYSSSSSYDDDNDNSEGGFSTAYKDRPTPSSSFGSNNRISNYNSNSQSSSNFNDGPSYQNHNNQNSPSISNYNSNSASEYSNRGSSGSGSNSKGFGFQNPTSSSTSISETEEAALIRELLQEGEITQEEIDEYRKEGGFGFGTLANINSNSNSNSFSNNNNNIGNPRGGRTLFPDEFNNNNNKQSQTHFESSQSYSNSNQDNFRGLPLSDTNSNTLGKRVRPTFNIETRLPPGASGPNAPASNSGSTFFPNDSDTHKFPSSSSQRQHQNQQNSSPSQQKSKIAFPGESSNHRVKRQLNSQSNSNYKSTFAAALARIVNKSQRQLNLGGACPSTYVCCRNPVRPQQQQQNYHQNNQNTYPATSNNNNNNFGNSGSGGLGFQNQNQNSFQSAPSNQAYLNNNQLGSNNNNGNQGFVQGSGQCGKRNARGITGRVSSGNNYGGGHIDGDTDYGEYPWQAALLKKDGYDNVYVCGGSLIDARHIVTAAHCIKGLQPSDLRVRLGEWDVNHETEFYPHVERDVIGLAIHPDFYAGNLFNDIAILRLDGYVDFRANPHISPICIPPRNTEFAGQRCFVTGWGKDAFGEKGKYQNVLKEVDMPVLRHFDCEQKLRRTRLGNDFVLHSGFLCAGGEEGKDACKGDGGGPLVCNVHGTWQLAGIVSWGVGCGQYDVPGVYIKVSQYQDWIRQTISGS